MSLQVDRRIVAMRELPRLPKQFIAERTSGAMMGSAVPAIVINPRFAWSFATAVSALLLLWFGVMAFLPFSARELSRLASLTPDAARVGAPALGVLQIALGIGLLPFWSRRVRGVAAWVAAVVWWTGLTLLAFPIAYVQDAPYSGFPYIGGGQSVLKHLELGALALALWAYWSGRATALRAACWGLWAGQLLVLVWIGLTKFTHYEALGVERLMRSSPLFSWLYHLFDVRSASSLIGVIELLTAALVALWPWRPRWGALGLAMAVVTYTLTVTFLFTTPGWEAGYGAPVVGSIGQFLLKDLGLMAGALLLLARPAIALAKRNKGTP